MREAMLIILFGIENACGMGRCVGPMAVAASSAQERLPRLAAPAFLKC